MSNFLNSIFDPFVIALRFLTHIPFPLKHNDYSEQDWGRSVLAYPLIGLIIGLILFFIYKMFVGHNAGVIAVLLLTVWVLLTGGLHIDGLADSADAWIGGHHDRERAFEIMKDACCGPVAVATVFLVLLIKFVALKALVQQSNGVAFILIPVLSRTAAVVLLLTTKYVREEEPGFVLSSKLPRLSAIIVCVVVVLLLIMFIGAESLKILFSLFVVGYLLRLFMLRRLGGMSGDAAGAFIEIIEAVLLLSFVL
jgi:adenosylcobinamide-GDP ribazoletransferase